ncbi:hypothetical protein NONO_c63710 [Nocardia nova SH22a]|uniref:PPE domain-containing protein n=1 Tax=Nocardia nova SH22a TaxID=1415166 RepID=W5TVD2_9NOCA|nr:hypothetical protein [Nocardia nova]AHH21141.1 hypothetical protein NONO_c63710 [Nocardia nova SH22a]
MHRLSGNGTPPVQGHTDPAYAPTVEVFDNLTHSDIQRGVLELRPEVLTQGRQAWQGSAAGVAEAVQSAHAEIRGAIADGWRGGAAQLAAEAVTAFEELGQQLSDVMAVVGQRLGQANDAAETLRATVSQPSVFTPNLEAALLDPKQATANTEQQKSAENLRQDAVRVMDTVYTGVFLRTGDDVPAFPEGSMYPNPAMGQPGPDPTAPGGGSADLTGTAVAPKVVPTTEIRPDAQPAAAPSADRPDVPAQPDADDPAPVAPAAATAPAAAVPVAPAPAAAVPPTVAPAAAVPGEPVVVASNPVVPPANSSSAAPPSPSAPVAPAAVRVAPASSTAPASNSQNSEQDGRDKRHDRDQDHGPSGDAISGMGAGVVGGLAGGAFAAGDAVRQSPPVALKPVRREDDEYEEDEDYYSEFEDEPTFLEPAEPGGDLVGRLDPTTPPVLGEWSEDD